MSRRPAPAEWHPEPRIWMALMLMLGLAAAPHLLRLVPATAVGWLAMVLWRSRIGLQRLPRPPWWQRMGLVATAAAALYFQHGSLVGRDAGSGLLVMMVGLKFFELHSRRDGTVLVFLCYFLLAIQFLFDQSIPTALYLAATSVTITAVWIMLSDPLGGRPWQPDLRRALMMTVKAIPLMLALFVLFPRIPGPLWSLPHDAHSGMTGLSGEMEPGSISNLARSEAIAFRVDFLGETPPPQQRYWRGPVMEVTDGRRWSVLNDEIRTLNPAALEPVGSGIRYRITLEPHGKPWLPALDYPVTAIEGSRLLADFQLRSASRVTERRRYDLVSHPALNWGEPDWGTWVRTQYLPEDTSARTLALAQQWRQEAGGERGVINRALQYFRQEPFVYTLTPPLLGRDPVDEFLFDSRRGFCEHYATAFTILMRAAGLPARVVTGYQGGELNALGDYLLVRQSDAHAWSEVWIEGEGWIRVDPTAAVAPERIELSIDLGASGAGAPIQFRLPEQDWARTLARRAGQFLDAMNNGWNQWVLSYGPSRQKDLFRFFGLPDVDARSIGKVVAVLLVIALLTGLLLQRMKTRLGQDPLVADYRRFCAKLAKLGVERYQHEGPRQFGSRAARMKPRLASEIRDITTLYEQLRYQPDADKQALRSDFRKRVHGFPS